MRRREEAVVAEVAVVAEAAELRMPWAAVECISVVAAAECVLAVRPVPAVARVWAACVSAVHLASLAGRRYPTLRHVLPCAASARLRPAAVRAGPRAAPQR